MLVQLASPEPPITLPADQRRRLDQVLPEHPISLQQRLSAIPLRAGTEYAKDRRAATRHPHTRSPQLRQLSFDDLELGKLAKNDRLEIVRAERTRRPCRMPASQHSNKGLETINFTRPILCS